jgi:hypothetical protein
MATLLLLSCFLPQTGLQAAAESESVAPLLLDAPIAKSSDFPLSHPAAKRVRLARLNTNLFSASNALRSSSRFVLNLFDDISPTAVIDRVETPRTSSTVHQGHLDGIPQGQFVAAYRNDVIAVWVFVPGKGVFQIQYAGDGLHKVIELDAARIPPCGVTNATIDIVGSAPAIATASTLSSRRIGKADANADGPVPGNNTPGIAVMDIMVVYTGQALTGAGSADAIETQIELGIALANRLYENSRINARLNLVYTGMTTNNSAETGDLNQERIRLREPSDGEMDDVFPTRARYTADLVCAIVERDDGRAGVADGMIWPAVNFQNSCFSVVARNYASTEILAHEIGHNLGCAHDRPNAANAGAFSFAYGHRFDANGTTYRTVMAYEPGLRVPNFSNPEVFFMGVPTGIPEGTTNAADNARAINLTSFIVAGYRGEPANDDFALRAPLVGTYLTVYDATTYATKEPGEPNHAFNNGGKSVWWTWTAPVSAPVTISTEGSSNPTGNYDTTLAVYTGTSVSNLTLVAYDNNSAPLSTSRLTFSAFVGTEYQIAVDGFNGASGTVVLSLSQDAAFLVNRTTTQDLNEGRFLLQLTGQPDLDFAIESSSDLINWIPLQTNKTWSGRFGFVDANASSNSLTYRARRVLP